MKSAALVLLALSCLGSAHAEMSAVVQCRIGSYAEQMPDFVCVALMKGAAKLTADGASVLTCYDETLRHIHSVDPDALTWLSLACGNIYGAKMYDAAVRGR